jgi:hypothetical protein
MVEKLIHNYCFFQQHLVSLTSRGEFAWQSVLWCRKSKTYSLNSCSRQKRWCLVNSKCTEDNWTCLMMITAKSAKYMNKILSPFLYLPNKKGKGYMVFYSKILLGFIWHLQVWKHWGRFSVIVMWPQHSHDLTTSSFHLLEVQKKECIKYIPTLWCD